MLSVMKVGSYSKASACWQRMRRATLLPGIQETPGRRQLRQRIDGLSVSLPETGRYSGLPVVLTPDVTKGKACLHTVVGRDGS